MSYYQVCTSYKLTGCKPQLKNITFHTTSEYYPFLVRSYTSSLSHSRFFHSVTEAEHYINYLFSRYPNSGLSFPVLDAQQITLF